MVPLPFIDVATGIDSFSASSTTSAAAPDAATPRQSQVDRSRRTARGLAEGLPQQVGHPLHPVDLRVELRDRVEHREVFDLLVVVAVARLRLRAAPEGDERRARP